jgi:uncharacterized protein (DUF433 family)
MAKDYVEQCDGGYFLEGTRVSLDSVVYAFLRGESRQGIAESFPALELEQIFGALAYYMANRDLVDRYLSDGRHEFEAMRQAALQNNPAFYAKLAEARRRSQTPSA